MWTWILKPLSDGGQECALEAWESHSQRTDRQNFVHRFPQPLWTKLRSLSMRSYMATRELQNYMHIQRSPIQSDAACHNHCGQNRNTRDRR